MHVVSLGVIFTCLIFVTACSTQPIQSTDALQKNQTWLSHKNKISNIHQWKISGRFGAQTESDSWNGSINWTQDSDKYNIKISGPLSSGSFSLYGDAELSTLKLSKDEVFEATDPDVLMETYTGLRLPIKFLRHWIVGLPSPMNNQPQIALNEEGQISRLSQKGWDISFKRYEKINNVFLPKKIFLENTEFDVRLVIGRWQITG